MPLDPHPDRTILYRLAFIRNCHILVLRGYELIKAEDLSQAEETSITGELVRGVREVLESEDAETWMQNFEVLDDPPQNVSGKLGRSRPRVDIEFVRLSGRGKRPRFHIEAKRLYRSDSVKEYFGDGGLGCFLVGRYADNEAAGGMLGYVQTHTSAEWLSRLGKGFTERIETLNVVQVKTLAQARDLQDLGPILRSLHGRNPSNLGEIEIFHLLLNFLPPATAPRA